MAVIEQGRQAAANAGASLALRGSASSGRPASFLRAGAGEALLRSAEGGTADRAARSDADVLAWVDEHTTPIDPARFVD